MSERLNLLELLSAYSRWSLTHKYLEGWLGHGENFIILSSTIFDWSTRCTDRRTERQTDGRVYNALSIYTVCYCTLKMEKMKKVLWYKRVDTTSDSVVMMEVMSLVRVVWWTADLQQGDGQLKTDTCGHLVKTCTDDNVQLVNDLIVKDRQCNLRYVAQCLYLMLLYSTHQHKSSILWMIATKTSQLVLQTSHDNLKLSSSFSADSWLWLRLAHYSTSVLRPNAEFTVEPCDLVPLVMYMPHLTLSRREYRALHHTLAQLRTSLASCSLSQSTVLHCTHGRDCRAVGPDRAPTLLHVGDRMKKGP